MSAEQNLTKFKFIKMSGVGNDFVIFDAREIDPKLTPRQIQKISNRKNIGCDQLIIIRPVDAKKDADCFMEIYNSDGSLSGACGNATRCVASIILSEISQNLVKIKTSAGILKCWREDNLISVNMGFPSFDWQKIPLSHETNSQKISLFGFEFSCVNVGNPHAVAFIKKPLAEELFFSVGSKVEIDPIFPQKTNVEFAQILSDNLIEVRVFERGSGETLACGSGACAVAIVAIKKQLVKSKKITIRFKGGDLQIQWSDPDSEVIMTGGFEKIFDGEIDKNFLMKI